MRALPGVLVLTLSAAAGLAACQGCGTTPIAEPATAGQGAPLVPTVRLYLVSTVAGALEPCGCTKDQLGGLDHLAGFVASKKDAAKGSLFLGVGPLLFLDPTLKDDDRATQSKWKAEAIARASKDIGLAGWVPGFNDWAAGGEALAKYRDASGGALVAANLDGVPGAVATVVREVGGISVGVVGVSQPKDKGGAAPESVRVGAAIDAMRSGLADAKKKGARVLVGLAAMPRGEALRLADAFPELHVLGIGKPLESGDLNDAQKSPAMVGSTLVVETANHLQTVAVIDLFVRGAEQGPIVFADAGGVAKADALTSLSARIRDLEQRLDAWEKDKQVKPEDLAARKADLERLRAEKAKLEVTQPPAAGSFFEYSVVEVREKLGTDQRVADQMLAYYKRVNEHNRTAFADRVPPPPEAGKAGFIGVEGCTPCHDDERKVWDGTPHAHAYATLQKGSKEFNLDCVACHVTGYGKAGGSTVTFVEKLQNVGCEECHGPGSLHAKSPKQKGLITVKPEPGACVAACHHPPHVEKFDAVEKTKLILGPGHGMD